MQGLEALMNRPDFDPEADSQIPALSKMLVTLQGSLQLRRAYLAGVLCNRLKNLNSHWLDRNGPRSGYREDDRLGQGGGLLGCVE